ncbi:protein-L-isoaspartate O-methyltransferase family protein [Pseudaminobacter soli (ex Li et al. 2025)]|uniref:Protein-L-isoaspartate O-methyltransferase n=1 Tax=Pseudaminobacter soli (ex Li et al. 2025) TaxID=1295366 RepID=A0A2P7S8F0_9HYPH|nr:protein-L-isoaspartate O-methyltransferase [Mesorhizobium soli]PSJ58595.1 protein-L-isoaspartate O-methyltransferase [Mesorhizobium soli]
MNTDFSEQRVKMVDGQVRTTDVTDPGVLEAMLTVPREAFVPVKRQALAYIDEHIEIAPAEAGKPARYLMQASPFAKLVQLADVRPTDFVLDIGCGTGYSAAVLSRLASSVVALESDAGLADAATSTLSSLGYDNVAVVQGPLQAGYAAEAPYDVIFLDGSVEELPKSLFDQLKEGGRLVAVEGQGNAGVARLFLKTTGVVTGRRAFNAAIRPLPGFERAGAFEF